MDPRRALSDPQDPIECAITALRDLSQRYQVLKPLTSTNHIALENDEIKLSQDLLLDVQYNFIEWFFFKMLLLELELITDFTGYTLYHKDDKRLDLDSERIENIVGTVINRYRFILNRLEGGYDNAQPRLTQYILDRHEKHRGVESNSINLIGSFNREVDESNKIPRRQDTRNKARYENRMKSAISNCFVFSTGYNVSNCNVHVPDARTMDKYEEHNSFNIDFLLEGFFTGMEGKLKYFLQLESMKMRQGDLEDWFVYFLSNLYKPERSRYALFSIGDLNVPKICENINNCIRDQVIYTSGDLSQHLVKAQEKLKLTLYNYINFIIDFKQNNGENYYYYKNWLENVQRPLTAQEIREKRLLQRGDSSWSNEPATPEDAPQAELEEGEANGEEEEDEEELTIDPEGEEVIDSQYDEERTISSVLDCRSNHLDRLREWEKTWKPPSNISVKDLDFTGLSYILGEGGFSESMAIEFCKHVLRLDLKPVLRKYERSLADMAKDESAISCYGKNKKGSNIYKVLFCINGCMAFAGRMYQDLDKCPYCDVPKNEKVYFLYTSPRLFFRTLFEDPEIAKELKKRRNTISDADSRKKDYNIYDVWDGDHLRNLRKKTICSYHTQNGHRESSEKYFEDVRDLAITIGTDGVNVWNRKHREHTVVNVYINNLPPSARHQEKNVFIPMIFPKLSPNSNSRDPLSFWIPLIDDFAEMGMGFEAKDGSLPSDSNLFNLKAHLCFIIGDMPAISSLMGLKGHSGTYPCRYCLQKRTVIETADGGGNRKHIAVPFKDADGNDAEKRDSNSYKESISEAYFIQSTERREQRGGECSHQAMTLTPQMEQQYEHLKGVSRKSPIFNLGCISLPYSFPPDIMHLLYANITKTFLGIISTHERLSRDAKTNINKYFEQLSGDISSSYGGSDIPKEVLEIKGNLMAATMKLINEFLPPVISIIESELGEVDKEITLLVEITNLLQIFVQEDHMDRKLIDILEDQLNRFLDTYWNLFYDENNLESFKRFTVPIHTLKHMADYIRHTGMPINHYAYSMERSCKKAKSLAQPCANPVKALSNKLLHRAVAQASDSREELLILIKNQDTRPKERLTLTRNRPHFINSGFNNSGGIPQSVKRALQLSISKRLGKFTNNPYPEYDAWNDNTSTYYKRMTFYGDVYYSKLYHGGIVKTPEIYCHMLVRDPHNGGKTAFAEFLYIAVTKHRRSDRQRKPLMYFSVIVNILGQLPNEKVPITVESAVYAPCKVTVGSFFRSTEQNNLRVLTLAMILGPAFYTKLPTGVIPESHNLKFLSSRHFGNKFISRILENYKKMIRQQPEIIRRQQREAEKREQERQAREEQAAELQRRKEENARRFQAGEINITRAVNLANIGEMDIHVISEAQERRREESEPMLDENARKFAAGDMDPDYAWLLARTGNMRFQDYYSVAYRF